jgi:hypothetical protein
MATVIFLMLAGWLLASVIGTMAYFRGEQTKPIHERNWADQNFEKIAQSLTNKPINYAERVPGFLSNDAFLSSQIPQ